MPRSLIPESEEQACPNARNVQRVWSMPQFRGDWRKHDSTCSVSTFDLRPRPAAIESASMPSREYSPVHCPIE